MCNHVNADEKSCGSIGGVIMAYWDSKSGKIVKFDTQQCDGYDAWEWIDCGCCAGLEWGGESPRECRTCGGSGWVARHKNSGVLAWYPGGPFCGVS